MIKIQIDIRKHIKVYEMQNLNTGSILQLLVVFTGSHCSGVLEHLVEKGQWPWTHASKPVNFPRELSPCPYCAMARVKRSSFTKPITIPELIRGLFFADVQGPFEVESLEGSVFKVGIIKAKTRFVWMTMASTKKLDGILDQWLKDVIPWMRVQHGLKRFMFQMDNGEFNSKACNYLVAALSILTLDNVNHREVMEDY